MLFLFLTGDSAYQDCPDNEMDVQALNILIPGPSLINPILSLS